MPPTVFADAFYWIAIARPRDPWHAAVLAWTAAHRGTRLVTTDEVLTEYLNSLSKAGTTARQHAVATVHRIRQDPKAVVLPQTRADFDAALTLYETRLDKEYSLVDCRSMVAMQSLGLTEVLSNDHHFGQEGFTVLFP
jgi:predicted nucleic acid-binding protein